MMESKDVINGLIICIVVIGGISYFLYHVNFVPEEGTHTGHITETGYAGLIWKTHYAKVVSAQFAYGDTGASWTYGFRESDANMNALYTEAQQYQQSNTLVNVHYICDFIVPLWEQTGSCRITSITQGV